MCLGVFYEINSLSPNLVTRIECMSLELVQVVDNLAKSEALLSKVMIIMKEVSVPITLFACQLTCIALMMKCLHTLLFQQALWFNYCAILNMVCNY